MILAKYMGLSLRVIKEPQIMGRNPECRMRCDYKPSYSGMLVDSQFSQKNKTCWIPLLTSSLKHISVVFRVGVWRWLLTLRNVQNVNTSHKSAKCVQHIFHTCSGLSTDRIPLLFNMLYCITTHMCMVYMVYNIHGLNI